MTRAALARGELPEWEATGATIAQGNMRSCSPAGRRMRARVRSPSPVPSPPGASSEEPAAFGGIPHTAFVTLHEYRIAGTPPETPSAAALTAAAIKEKGDPIVDDARRGGAHAAATLTPAAITERSAHVLEEAIVIYGDRVPTCLKKKYGLGEASQNRSRSPRRATERWLDKTRPGSSTDGPSAMSVEERVEAWHAKAAAESGRPVRRCRITGRPISPDEFIMQGNIMWFNGTLPAKEYEDPDSSDYSEEDDAAGGAARRRPPPTGETDGSESSPSTSHHAQGAIASPNRWEDKEICDSPVVAPRYGSPLSPRTALREVAKSTSPLQEPESDTYGSETYPGSPGEEKSLYELLRPALGGPVWDADPSPSPELDGEDKYPAPSPSSHEYLPLPPQPSSPVQPRDLRGSFLASLGIQWPVERESDGSESDDPYDQKHVSTFIGPIDERYLYRRVRNPPPSPSPSPEDKNL